MNLILRLLRLDVAGINKTDLAIFSSRERMKRVIPKPSLTACTSLPVSLIFKSLRQMKDGYGSVSQSVSTDWSGTDRLHFHLALSFSFVPPTCYSHSFYYYNCTRRNLNLVKMLFFLSFLQGCTKSVEEN